MELGTQAVLTAAPTPPGSALSPLVPWGDRWPGGALANCSAPSDHVRQGPADMKTGQKLQKRSRQSNYAKPCALKEH